MAEETTNRRGADAADPAWQKLTPAADTTMDVKTDDPAQPPVRPDRAPQNVTGTPESPATASGPSAPSHVQGPIGGHVGGLAGRGGPGNDAPLREGDVGIANDLPHGMSESLSDDALGGTMAEGAASPGAASTDRRDRERNPGATDTAVTDEGRQRVRNPPG